MSGPARKGYLDWVRGLGVLIMIQGHVMDSWTAVPERSRDAYRWIDFVGGIGGAPVFLLLAGVAVALSIPARMRRGRSELEAVALARRRGWELLGLAFLFRLQSWFISGGSPWTMLKVDILNVLGIGMLAAAVLWMTARRAATRMLVFAAATLTLAMLTPVVRAWEALAVLPDPLEAYLRPAGSATTFTLLPWVGFLLAGCVVGLWLDTADARRERRVNVAIGLAGAAIALAGYGASFLPALYAETNFWTSSPTFFFVRLGLVLLLLPAAYAWNAWSTRYSPLQHLGRSSLFVYWIHVELAYGVLSAPLHKRLPLELAWVGFVLFAIALYLLVRVKDRITADLPPLVPRAAGRVTSVWSSLRGHKSPLTSR